MPGNCPLLGSTAADLARNGLNTVQNFAEAAIQDVEDSIAGLTDLINGLTPVDVDIDLENAGELSDPFTIGPAPTVDSITVTMPTIDYNPTFNTPTFTLTAEHPGDFTGVKPELNLPNSPGALDAEAPTNVPEIGDYPFPTTPTDDIPELPTLAPIVIPDVPDLTLPEFDAVEPAEPIIDAFGVFTWTEDAYVPTVRDEVVDQLTSILGGSIAIPDSIWDMIWSRGRRQLRMTAEQARQEAKDYWASRGHFLSNGQLRQRIKEAADVEREGASEIIREQLIQEAKLYVERLNFAIAQGIALEGQLIGLHNAQQERAFNAARAVFEIGLQVANFKIVVYNAKMAAYLQKAQIFQTLMQGELARLEVTKAEIEAQKLVGELNQQKVEIYRAQLEGYKTVYDIFRAEIEAVVAKYEADKTRVAAFAETVNAYKAQVDAYEAEWRGYAEAVKAEISKLDAYKVESDVYLGRIQAYATGVDADKAAFEAQLAPENFKMDRLRVALDKYKTEAEGEFTRVRSEVSANELDVRIFEALNQAERYRVESDAQRLAVLINNANMRMQAQIQETQLKIQEAQNLLQVQTNGLQAIIAANSQIGASALNALHYSAQLQDQMSNSQSCQTSYNYQY